MIFSILIMLLTSSDYMINAKAIEYRALASSPQQTDRNAKSLKEVSNGKTVNDKDTRFQAIDTRQLSVDTLIDMKDALNTVISHRLRLKIRRKKLNLTGFTKLSKMKLDPLIRIDDMLHRVISKRFMHWKIHRNAIKRVKNANLQLNNLDLLNISSAKLKLAKLKLDNVKKNDSNRQNRVKRSASFYEKKLNPIYKARQLPTLSSWVRCGGPYLDLVPLKKRSIRKRRFFKKEKDKEEEKLSKLCIQKLR